MVGEDRHSAPNGGAASKGIDADGVLPINGQPGPERAG
jgi:hypothetical protein